MSKRISLRYKIVALVLALVLIVPILAACGGDNEEKTTTPVATTPVKTTPVATTPAITKSDKPVKIGVLIDYSGPAAQSGWLADGTIGFANWYFNEKQGGIQVGDVRRPVEFRKYDTKSEMGLTAAAALKAVNDGCVAVTLGGVSLQFGLAVADVTDPAKVLFSTFLDDPAFATNYKYVAISFFNKDRRIAFTAKTAVEGLKAKTVGILCMDLELERTVVTGLKQQIKALDPNVKIVSEQYYPIDLKDFSPLLTRLKYEKPDVLIMDVNEAAATAIAQQIMELGGWGGMQVVGYAEGTYFKGIEKSPGAEGWIIPLMYLNGQGSPAAIAFSKDWAAKCESDPGWCKTYSPTGSVPLPNYPVMYNPLLTAVKAIELAGTDDRIKVSEAARSGKLEFDSPLGPVKIGTNGRSDLVPCSVSYFA